MKNKKKFVRSGGLFFNKKEFFEKSVTKSFFVSYVFCLFSFLIHPVMKKASISFSQIILKTNKLTKIANRASYDFVKSFHIL